MVRDRMSLPPPGPNAMVQLSRLFGYLSWASAGAPVSADTANSAHSALRIANPAVKIGVVLFSVRGMAGPLQEIAFIEFVDPAAV